MSSHTVFLLSSLVIGGSERKTIRIANELAASDSRVTIAYLSGPHTLRDEISSDIEVIFLDKSGKFGFAALRRLVAYVSKNEIQQIFCVNTYPLIYAFLSRYLLNGKALRVIAAINETEFVRWSDELKMLLYVPILRRIDDIVFGCAYQRQLWVRKYKLDRPDCTYIYNGVNTNRFCHSGSGSLSKATRNSVGIPEKCLVIGSVGQFRKEKQYHHVVHACRALREKAGLDAHCILVGGGFEEQLLKDLVTELDCDHYVHLIDAVGDVTPYLEAMDIFVLSSISETFSNAALEAMAMGLPVVLPRVGGCPEMVESGKTGFIYEPGDIGEFVDCLSLLGCDEERRVKMGQAARRSVETKFHFQLMFSSYLNLIEAGESLPCPAKSGA